MALKASRRGTVPPFIVMDVMRAANRRQAEGGDVLHLELGQPATGAPSGVLDAARTALERDQLGYTEAFGLEPLRRRIAAHYQATQNVAVDPERIVITTGSSGGFVLAFLAAFDAGDRVALADPGYPAYRNILLALGVQPVMLPTGPGTRFQPTPELLDAIDGPIDGLIVASPSNPAGTMIGEAEMRALVEWCHAHGVRLISDEIYHGITYGRPAVSALRFGNEAVVINSFSKYFSMTGWRIGWMAVPDDLLRSVECLAQNLYISPPTLSQHAAMAVFDCTAELDANVARYARNRELLLRDLPLAGFDRLAPADGAFYLYADVANLTNDSEDFCRRMLAETGVATTPGIDFDRTRGRAWIRISFSGDTEQIAEAVRRMARWTGRGGQGT
jgi:aspartate/methionine/tyrosine aminotransferase